MTSPENRCVALGCPAACCRNIGMDLPKKEAERFLKGQKVGRINMHDYEVSNLDEIPSIKRGIYIIEGIDVPDGHVYIYIRDFCPHVNKATMDCDIFGMPERPGVCGDVNIGDYTCDVKRSDIGLAPVHL